jgi:translation initiation factor 1
MVNNQKNSSLVYSSELGRICPKCEKQAANCSCKKGQNTSKDDGVVRIRRETKGRKGKGVTVITGIPLGLEEVKKLAKELKARCGSGGTVKDGTVEIQGDHCEMLMIELKKKGWIVKRSGG